ncbi:MAG: hypothetical protein U0236_14570 [Nitrospira sp.]
MTRPVCRYFTTKPALAEEQNTASPQARLYPGGNGKRQFKMFGIRLEIAPTA